MDYAEKLDAIHADVRGQGRRLTALEHVVNGNPDAPLPSGLPDRGLVGIVYEHGQVVTVVRHAIKVGKWVAITFATATLALLANIALDALPSGG